MANSTTVKLFVDNFENGMEHEEMVAGFNHLQSNNLLAELPSHVLRVYHALLNLGYVKGTKPQQKKPNQTAYCR